MAEIDRWALERACWAGGIALVCGCDEAGAGPLAGAVYAGAVILPPECSIEGLNDSKHHLCVTVAMAAKFCMLRS